jgi:hypothetical protein
MPAAGFFPHQPDDICGSIVLFHLIQSNGAHSHLPFTVIRIRRTIQSTAAVSLVHDLFCFWPLIRLFFIISDGLDKATLADGPALLSAASYFPLFRRIGHRQIIKSATGGSFSSGRRPTKDHPSAADI